MNPQARNQEHATQNALGVVSFFARALSGATVPPLPPLPLAGDALPTPIAADNAQILGPS